MMDLLLNTQFFFIYLKLDVKTLARLYIGSLYNKYMIKVK